MSFPVVPVDTLPERKRHFQTEQFEGDVPQNDGKCSTSRVSKKQVPTELGRRRDD